MKKNSIPTIVLATGNQGKVNELTHLLAEHNIEILSSLGYSQNEIEELKMDRII